MKVKSNHNFLYKDIAIVIVSILIAYLIIETRILGIILDSTLESKWIGSFVAGLFFTSVFTTAPAIVTLGEIARESSVFAVAFFGSIGALVGDIIIFQFIRDRFSEHLLLLVQHNSKWKRLKVLLKLRYFRWITFLIGGLLIASPFPDELGISFLGFSKMRMSYFVPISLIFNFLGILAIGIIAKAL